MSLERFSESAVIRETQTLGTNRFLNGCRLTDLLAFKETTPSNLKIGNNNNNNIIDECLLKDIQKSARNSICRILNVKVGSVTNYIRRWTRDELLMTLDVWLIAYDVKLWRIT